MRYFGSNPMFFFCFDDCLIKFSHCFKLFIICLFHVRLSQLNADMKMFKPFCRLSIRSTHCSKGNEDCFVSMPIVSLVRTVSHFNAHCSKAFEKRCIPSYTVLQPSNNLSIYLPVYLSMFPSESRAWTMFNCLHATCLNV